MHYFIINFCFLRIDSTNENGDHGAILDGTVVAMTNINAFGIVTQIIIFSIWLPTIFIYLYESFRMRECWMIYLCDIFNFELFGCRFTLHRNFSLSTYCVVIVN